MSCPDATAFSAFVGGVLPAGEREQLELHIDACERCRVALSETCRSASRAPVTALPAAGDRVGRYTIAARLGAGAMGVVYAARDGELDRDVAIKLVQPQAGAPEDELVRQRMLREGRALARIDHPNVVRVLDIGDWNGALFVAMEHVAGVPLGEWLAAERRSVAEIVGVFVQCAHGLAAAHAAGVIHRDVKPDNIIVDERGRARLADFGLATTAPGSSVAASDDTTSDPRLTRTDGLVGTPAYMAPEQRTGGQVDERADQYALCVALAEALTGTRPTTSTVGGVPRRVRAVLARGLALDPARRFPSVTTLASALDHHAPRWPWVAVPLALASIAYVVWPSATGACADAALDPTWRGAPLPAYVRGALDRYAASWRTTHAAACSAQQIVTLRCLDRRRRELAAVLGRWDARAPSAAETVDALAPPERCAGAELDPESVALTVYEARFAAAAADASTGRAPQAASALTALAGELDTLPALRAETLVELGATESELGRVAPARDHFIAAVAAAETAGAPRTRATAWISLAALAGDEAVRLDEARDALRLSGAVLENLRYPEDLVLRREVARGLVALRTGDHTEAVAALRTAVRGELPPTELARRLQILARALIAQGNADAALAELEHAERVLIAALGPDAPPLAYVYNSMIDPLDYLGRREEAIARGERALALLTANYGADNPHRGGILNNVASIEGNLKHYDRALALLQEALAIHERAHDDYRTGEALVNIASTLLDAGRTAEAIAPLDRGAAIFTRVLGAEHPLLANVHSMCAQAELAQHHPDAALVHARRALAIREATRAGGTGYLAYARFELADTLVAAGHRTEGIAMARRALELPLAATGREGELAAEIRSWLAKQLR